MTKKDSYKRRILIDARFYGSSENAGLGVYTEELVNNVLELDPTTEYLLLMRDRDKGLSILHDNATPVFTDIEHYSYKEQIALPLLISKLKPDLVHFTNFNSPVIGPRFKNIVTVHDLTLMFHPGRKQTPLKRLGYKAVMQGSIKRADQIIAISQYTKDDLVKHFHADPSRVTVVHEAAPARIKKITDPKKIATLRSRFNIHDPFLLYVGAWRKHKNLVAMIRAFHLLLRRNPKAAYQLVLVGKKDEAFPEIPETISKLGLKDRVIMTGYASDDEISTFFSAAEGYIIPSLYEGFGIPPLEAMRVGLPVLSSTATCLPEILGPAAHYFDPLSIEDMALKMNEVMTSFSLRKKLSESGLKWIKRYTPKKMAKETLDVYDAVLNNAL
jgi:glycosyltransferase involved in cell wall biosynthesis